MGIKAPGVIYALVVVGLACAAFNIGHRFQPDSYAGHNLYALHERQGWPQTTSNNFLLTGLHKNSKQVADNDPAAPETDESMADDSFGNSPAATFQQVYLLLKRNFVDGIPDDGKLAHGAVSAMLASLQDPQSRFLEKDQLQAVRQKTDGRYGGIGAVIEVRKRIHARVVGTKAAAVQAPSTVQAPSAVQVLRAVPAGQTPSDAPPALSPSSAEQKRMPSKGPLNDIPSYTDYQLTVVVPLPGSPAEKAGLKSGDVITDIDKHWVASYDPVVAESTALKAAQRDPVALKKIVTMINKKIDTALSIAQAENKLDGPSATPLVLTVTRAGEPKPLQITVAASATTEVPPVVSRSLPGDLGYIKIPQFVPGTDVEMGKALESFGGGIKGLILDLRNTPGGPLDAGASIAARLTSAKTFGYVRTKGKHDTAIPIKSASAVTCPIVVLVNGGTASSAELLAAVLHGQGAKIVGTTTFGDASDVQVIELRDGSGFTMTIGELLKADQQPFLDAGIKPDVNIPDSNTSDQPLTAAIGLLSGRVASGARVRG